MYETYVKTGMLNYLLTYKMSQDHLELLFMGIRSSYGFNNNPDVEQFQATFKKLIMGAAIRGKYGNCQILDNCRVLTSQGLKERNIQKVREEYSLSEDDNHLQVYLDTVRNTTEFKSNIVVYLAGYVEKRILDKETCDDCKKELKSARTISCDLIDIKNRGGLMKPSQDVLKVVKDS